MNVSSRSYMPTHGHVLLRSDWCSGCQRLVPSCHGVLFLRTPIHSWVPQSRWKLKMTMEDDPVPSTKKDESESIMKPNYAIWIFTFMTVIAIFYGIVFYAGAGLFYFLSKKIGFKKKDYIPYTERMEQEREAMKTSLEQMKEAPSPEVSELDMES